MEMNAVANPIQPVTTTIVEQSKELQGSQNQQWNVGDVVTGQIINRTSSEIEVKINNQRVTIPNTDKVIEKVGESIDFKIDSISKKRVALTYIKPETGNESTAQTIDQAGNQSTNRSEKYIKGNELQKANHLQKNSELQKTQDAKKIQEAKNVNNRSITTQKAESTLPTSADQAALVKLKADVEVILQITTEEDLTQLEAQGLNPEKMTIQSIQLHVLDLKSEVTESTEVMPEKVKAAESLDFFKLLDLYQLPKTTENVDKIQEALDKWQAASKMTDAQVGALLKNKVPNELTLEDLYKNNFSGPNNKARVIQNQPVSVETLAALEPQIKSRLESAGTSVTTAHIEEVKALIRQDVPVDAQTLKAYFDIKEALTTKDSEILNRIAQIMTTGKEAIKVKIYEQTKAEATQTAQQAKVVSVSQDKTSEVVMKVAKEAIEAVVKEVMNKVVIDPSVSTPNTTSTTPNTTSTTSNTTKVTTPTPVVTSVSNKVTPQNKTSIDQILETLPKVTARDLEKIVQDLAKKQMPENLENIVEDYQQLEVKSEVNTDLNVKPKESATYNQLVQIREKMSYDIAVKLESKGIDVRTMALEPLAEEVKVAFEEKVTHILEVNQVPVTPENVEATSDVLVHLQRLKLAGSDPTVKVLKKEAELSIRSIGNALERYEFMETKPRRDLGDRIEKAFTQIESLMNESNIEVTPENEQAVKILARSEMPITPENVEVAKSIEARLNRVVTQMNPEIVVKMIDQKISPLDMHVDEVLQYMDQFQAELGTTDYEKVLEGIYKLDQSDVLTPESRESLIGIYRMFSTIAKSEGAAAGFLVKNDLSLTMGNLMDAANYLRRTKSKDSIIEAKVDNQFGMLEKVQTKAETPVTTIRQQILTAIQNGQPVESLQEVLKQQLNQASMKGTETQIDNIKALVSQGEEPIAINLAKQTTAFEGIKQMIAEVTKALDVTLRESATPDSKVASKTDLIKELESLKLMTKETSALIDRQLENKSVQNMRAVQALNEKTFEWSNQLDQVFKQLKEQNIPTTALENLLSLKNMNIQPQAHTTQLKAIEDALEDLRDDVIQSVQKTDTSTLKTVQHSTEIQKMYQTIAQNENYYQVPIYVDGTVKQLNVYWMNEEQKNNARIEEKVSVYMYFKTESMGKVGALVQLDQDKISCSITAENESDVERLQKFKSAFEKVLDQTGFNTSPVGFDAFEPQSILQSDVAKEQQEVTTSEKREINNPYRKRGFETAI